MKIKSLIILTTLLFTLVYSSSSYAINVVDYAPIFYFESEEKCFPIDAEFQLTYSYLYNVDNAIPVSTNPLLIDLSSYSSDDYKYFYLDNQQGTPNNFDKIVNDSKNWENLNGNTVYYRIYHDLSTGISVIQYWLFYAFNNGELNKHEGDWEMVQIVFNGEEPSLVAYSQHHSGQKVSWNQVEKDGNHIKVYVARGSHANYLRSFSGKLGISSDYVGANGRVLKLDDYSLKNLDNQSWLNYRGRWGECGSDSTKFASAEALGSNGPEGPKYRKDGSMWNNPVSWGQGLSEPNDLIFLLEWFIYNFILIIVIITLIILGLKAIFIYQRHKKYGLGPRIFSMFYIDGFNLRSIGNILCIVGIITALISLFYTWYFISIDISELNKYSGIQTTGMQDLINIHSINGIHISVPVENGFKPVATISVPFGIFIGIGLLFLIIGTIGISHSKKLGRKYVGKGVRLFIPIILIILAIMSINIFIPSNQSNDTVNNIMVDILRSISSSPFGNQKTFYVTQDDVTVAIPMSWGLGLGTQLLLVSGIIFVLAGIFEIFSNTQFFVSKEQEKDKAKISAQTVVPQPSSKKNFCAECGAEIREDDMFCSKCGKKQK